jgi:hypothetical protein
VGAIWLYIAIAVLVCFVLVVIFLLDTSLQREREFMDVLDSRVPLTDVTMVKQYFATDNVDPQLPPAVRRIFAKHMQYPAEKLLPDDDFAFYWEELEAVHMVREIETHFGVTLSYAAVEATPCTIRAMSMLVASKQAGPCAESNRFYFG